MKNSEELKLKATDILQRKTLIIGESASGKTRLAARLAEDMIATQRPDTITIIDFAPERTEQTGGKLTDYLSIPIRVRYLAPREVHTPRLAGTSQQQILQLAGLNRRLMDPLLGQFIKNTTEVLIMNDITLYLHLGRLERILQCVRLAKTFLGTAYYGVKLANDMGTGISHREKRLTDELAASMDQVVKLS